MFCLQCKCSGQHIFKIIPCETALVFSVRPTKPSYEKNTQGGKSGGQVGGKGFKKGQKNAKYKQDSKKSPTNKKYLFTVLENSADVSVSTYETTLKKVYEFLMENIKENPADVVDSLKLGQTLEIPEPKYHVSTHLDPETEKMENKALGYDYVQARVERRKREDTLKMNLRLAYTLIFSQYCDTALRHKIESKEKFSRRIEGDPYELLAVIKEIMHSTSSQKHVSPYEAL